MTCFHIFKFRFRLHQSFVCAGGEAGNDACRGDGGSPLVCPLKGDPDRIVQVGIFFKKIKAEKREMKGLFYEKAGIVAWGLGCGEEGLPGVYADVAGAACWIDFAATCYGDRVGENTKTFTFCLLTKKCIFFRTLQIPGLRAGGPSSATGRSAKSGCKGNWQSGTNWRCTNLQITFPPSFPGSPLAAAEGTGGAGGSAICQSQSGSSTRGATWSGKRDKVSINAQRFAAELEILITSSFEF